jgi:hypothetical protein
MSRSVRAQARIVSPLIRRMDAIELVAGEGMLQRMEKAGWISARVRQRNYVVYRREDILAAVARLDAGEYPSA